MSPGTKRQRQRKSGKRNADGHLLAVDCGNTSVSFCVFKGKRIVHRASVVRGDKRGTFFKSLKTACGRIRRKCPSVSSVCVCSVVPGDNKRLRSIFSKNFGAPVRFTGRDIRVPIKNRYRKPKQVGQDRLVGAYAASRMVKAPVIIIDFGTAITFDVVNRQGEYEGGIILPGILMSAETLSKRTALLPRIDKIKSPRSLVGKNTQESILSGIFYGYGAMCQGLIAQLKKKIGGSPKVVVTGGYTDMMARYISGKITRIEPDLVFKGLRMLREESS